jgi:hypothetical protein
MHQRLVILRRRIQVLPMLRLICIVSILLASALRAQTAELAPFKDELFAYPAILEQTDGGRRVVIDYNEMRDINGRDIEPERHVRRQYVSPLPNGAEQDVTINAAGKPLKFMQVGRPIGASIIVAYLHGKGGDRKQGQNDSRFGGNFNRIRNLMLVNGGLYITPDFSDFGDKGEEEAKAVLEFAINASPKAELFVACGSMGGFICHRLAADATFAPKMSGMLLLGSFPDPDFQKSVFFKSKIPLFIGHGGADKTSPVADMEAFYASIRKASPSYPVWLHRFETGSHGTPVRMSDWRLALNQMLAAR